jgi:hypothetical protein
MGNFSRVTACLGLVVTFVLALKTNTCLSDDAPGVGEKPDGHNKHEHVKECTVNATNMNVRNEHSRQSRLSKMRLSSLSRLILSRYGGYHSLDII